MSILLLPVSRVTSAFFVERIASATSACDFLLFIGMLRHPFFCYNKYVITLAI